MKKLKLSITTVILSAIALAAVIVGCAGSKTGEATPPQPAKATANRPPEPAAKLATPAVMRSVFTIDENSRDPFFPRKKAVLAKATASANSPQQQSEANLAELPALFSAGLQGIGGTPERRIAVINNVILERGRATSIPLSSPNQNRRVPVKCRDITRDSVILDVEGYGQVVVTRSQTL